MIRAGVGAVVARGSRSSPSVAFPSRWACELQKRTATKKAGGVVKNTSGSPGQRLGLKKFGGAPVIPGNIILRQRGRKYWEGENVGCSRDFTLWALVEGRVRFEKIRRKNGKSKTVVHVDSLFLPPECVQYVFEDEEENLKFVEKERRKQEKKRFV